MKLIIQIPCFNESAVLPTTLAQLPRTLPGVDRIEWLVIDDGSTDGTADVARAAGVDHVVRFPRNRGLARAFMAGLEACVARGADLIVNTDADNQYPADEIPRLIEPILAGRAELVIGARRIAEIEHFSGTKKLLQRLGSWVVRSASGTSVPDGPSGFRALTRDAALRMNVFGSYTYTLETIIQAGHADLAVESVSIRTNPFERPSRLIPSVGSYVRRSAATIFRIFLLYRPFRVFVLLGTVPIAAGLALFVRWVVLFLIDDPTRARTPSLIAGAVLVMIGFQLWTFALIADLLAANRRLLEDVQRRVRGLELPRSRGERP